MYMYVYIYIYTHKYHLLCDVLKITVAMMFLGESWGRALGKTDRYISGKFPLKHHV